MGFVGQWTVLCGPAVMDARHDTFTQTQRMLDAEGEPRCKPRTLRAKDVSV